MLKAYPGDGNAVHSTQTDLAGKGWVDLVDPTREEVAAVEAAFGLHVPDRGELSEIEASSRLRVDGDAVYMSAPLITSVQGGGVSPTPTGFVLSKHVLLTVRFERTGSFDRLTEEMRGRAQITPGAVFLEALEMVVDRAADTLEVAADALNTASQVIFRDKAAKGAKLSRTTSQLREVMTSIGRASERMSHVRYTLVCIGRMAQFVGDRCTAWIGPNLHDRLHAVRADIASLEQYEENLLSRVQLLQDAATAFISIEQNDVVKVLTIASVAGIPPVLVVGVYGMNFKIMPELTWTYGYPYALALIVVSIVVPLAWFKLKDWM